MAKRRPVAPSGDLGGAKQKEANVANLWVAYTKAPTTKRPHRIVRASGDTETEALLALASVLAELGATGGEITTHPLSAEDVA